MATTLLQRLEQRGFDDLRGARLHLELPASRALLNFYTTRLEERKAIHDVQIVSIRGMEVVLNVRTTIPFFKDRTLTARFHEKIDRLLLNVELTDGISFFERTVVRPFLPAGIELDGRTLRIDLRYFMSRNPRMAVWADKIREARIASGRGENLLFIFDLII